MKVVAYTELVIFVRVLLGAITFQNALLSPLVYAHFLRQRYYQSAFTRAAFHTTVDKIDKFIHKPGNPPVLVQIWDKVQVMAIRWGGSNLAPAAGGEGPR